MTSKKIDIKQHITKEPPRKKLVASGVAELIFMLIGAALTLGAFFTLNIFVGGLVRAEYDRTSQHTVELLAGRMNELEKSIETIVTMLSITPDADRQQVFDRIKAADIPVGQFDEIALFYQKEPGKWQLQFLHESAEGVPHYGIKSDKNFLSFIVNERLLWDTKIRTLTDERFLSFSGGVAEQDGHPFALVKALKKSDFSAGLLIGVTNGNKVFDSQWLTNTGSFSHVSVKDQIESYEILNVDRQGGAPQKADEVAQSYEFSFADRKWEVKIQYFKEDKIYFLETVPFFLLIFGLILTATGTLYIHSNQQQSTQASQINAVLEQKNSELQFEVSERARLNKVLTKSEREHRAILDSVSDIIFETDTQGKILFLNGTWQKVTGFDPEQSKGLELIKMLHPQDQDKQQKDFQMLVRGHRQAYRSFSRLRTSEGTFRAVEIAVSMIRQDENKALRVVGTITDVEERRRAERALGEAEKKYRNIVENAAGGIFQLTPEGVYLSANLALARILGYDSPEELLRSIKNANETVYCNIRERQTFLRELDAIGMISNFETEVFRKDGTRIWVNENIRVVRDDAGNSLYYEGSIEDITRRKKSDIALREAKIFSDLANRAKSEFLANMSHELRTPLNAIIGFSEIIKNEIFGAIEQPSYKEYAKDIHESGKRLLKVINEILDISKIEAGDRQLNEGIIDLKAVIASCYKLLEGKATASKLTVTNLMGDVPQIIGEELAVKQIMMNLLSNAIKFTPHGGRVTISSDVDPDGSVRISFTDTGVGLDEIEIKKALSPFGQVNNDLSRSNAGTGLGLTLVDALVKLHNGKLELFSQKGIGTTATVVFPASRLAQKKPKSDSAGVKEKV